MGLMGFLKAAETAIHAALDQVPTAGFSVYAVDEYGNRVEKYKDMTKEVFTEAKAQEWAFHLNGVQQESDEKNIQWIYTPDARISQVDAQNNEDVLIGEIVDEGP